MSSSILRSSLLLVLIPLGGCMHTGAPAPRPPQGPLVPGLNTIRLTHGGLERAFDVRLPAGFDAGRAYPLVFWFHGIGGHKEVGHDLLDGMADREGFIAVYPQGDRNSWNVGIPLTTSADDVGFTGAMLTWIGERVRLDPARLHAVGYSNGGHFCHLLAQRTASFASVASVAASFFAGSAQPSEIRPLSVMQVHGDRDDVVPFDGGWSPTLGVAFQSAPSTLAWWATALGLEAEPTFETPEAGVTITRHRRSGSPHEAALVRLHGADHGLIHPYFFSGRCYEGIWNFFRSHPKPELRPSSRPGAPPCLAP